MKDNENNSQNLINENAALQNKKNASALYSEKKAKKEGVVKGILTTAIISFILIVAAGITAYSLYNRDQERQLAIMEDQKQVFSDQLTARDSAINEWVLTFDQIEKDLNMVKEKENIIAVESADREFSKDRKEQILKDIEYINTLLEQNKKKIASLNAQLKKSGGTLNSLQNKIAELESSMQLRETEISELKTALVEKDFEIGELNTRMTDLQITLAQKDDEINNQTDDMNKAYLASGTYKDLKERGLILKEGGFLGLGKKESLIEDFADSSFSQINITETLTIPVHSKVAKLITEHPTTSYELIRDTDNTIAYIEIKDPDQFWKISKYAVVEIKN